MEAVQDPTFDDTDMLLLHALQIQPRASWTAMAKVIGVNPVTLARHWQRLAEGGLAWVAGYPTHPGRAAIVEIESMSGSSLEVAQILENDREVLTIDVTGEDRDLVITVVAPDERRLYGYLLDRLQTIGTIGKVFSHPVAASYAEASAWRLRALDALQVQALKPRPTSASALPRHYDNVDAVVMAELARNGRISAPEIAERNSLNVRRVRLSIQEILDSGRMRLRTDIVRSLSGWPVYAWYFLSVPATQIDRIASQLARISEMRAVMSIVGSESNIAAAVWMRTLSDVSRLEGSIESHLPDIRIAHRSVVMRTTKLAGHLLDSDGRKRGYVPISLSEQSYS